MDLLDMALKLSESCLRACERIVVGIRGLFAKVAVLRFMVYVGRP